MPDVRGKPLSEAQALLTAAGFPVLLQGDTSSRGGREAVVVAQAPAPRAKVSRGEKVTLTSEGADSPRAKHRVVVLDPGHQVRADLTPEPIGPGARESKERVTAGSVGVSTGRSECEVSLELALRVRARLQEAGVEVVLTRTTNSAALSNAQRAEIANRAGADLFVRLHADAVEEAAVRGVSVLYPAGNRWVTGIAADSRRAADTVRTSAVRTSGAPDRGSAARADLAGFNYCRVPAILVEAGCLSNVEDDRLLGTAAYQDKLADGIVAGVLAYFGR
jgi:N-acetylmuramoyl-L-alanine amidase